MSPSQSSPQKKTQFRWVICGLLFFSVALNYIDRNIIGILKMDLSKELGWTELDYAREGLNEGFKFNNPNVKDACGCGESFNV